MRIALLVVNHDLSMEEECCAFMIEGTNGTAAVAACCRNCTSFDEERRICDGGSNIRCIIIIVYLGSPLVQVT